MKKYDEQKNLKDTKIGIFLFRSLYSQSAASLSAGKFSATLLNNGYSTKMKLLKHSDYIENFKQFQSFVDMDIIVYKTNYKDFEYGIRFFEKLIALYPQKRVILCGSFAVMNKEHILKKWAFVHDIVNILNKDEVDNIFPVCGTPHVKQTVVYNVDREIEYLEQGSYINVESSEGCMYKCNFCHVNLLKYPYNIVPIDELIDEIEYLVNTMGKKYLIFNDSIFWKGKRDNNRIIDFCHRIKERDIEFSFLIYLTLYPPIPEDILDMLTEVGLVRIFFGVESITTDFQQKNPKKLSGVQTKKFIDLLKYKRISYHIGFMLFFPELSFENIFVNLQFLCDINKVIRLGILVEKMRVLPKSKNAEILYESNEKIDQAYNYNFIDSRVQRSHDLICEYLSSIDIRFFESFFTSIDLAIAILASKKQLLNYQEEEMLYIAQIDSLNKKLHENLKEIIERGSIKLENKDNLLSIYAEAEVMYIVFFLKLQQENYDIYTMIPHGKEQLNR